MKRDSFSKVLHVGPAICALLLFMALGVTACSADYGTSDPNDSFAAPSLTMPGLVSNSDSEPADDEASDAAEEGDAALADDEPVVQSSDSDVEADPLQIETAELESWTQGMKNTQILKANGGSKKYRWAADGLPEGLTLKGKKIRGTTAAEAKVYIVTITLTDKVTDESVEEEFELRVEGKNAQVTPGGSLIGGNFAPVGGAVIDIVGAGVDSPNGQVAPLTLTVNEKELRRSMANPNFMDEKCSEAGITDPVQCAAFRDAQQAEDESIAQTKVPGQSGKLSDNEVARAFRVILTVKGGKAPYTWNLPEPLDANRYYPDVPVTHIGAGWEAIHPGRDEAWQGKEGWECNEHSDADSTWTGCKYVFVPIIMCEWQGCYLQNGTMEPGYLEVMYDNPHTLRFTVRDAAGSEQSIEVMLAVTLGGKTCVENGKCG